MITFRRFYLDKVLSEVNFKGSILDIGGKKDNKRGTFRPPLSQVKSWEYLNTDALTNPDYCCSAEDIPIDNEQFDIVLMAEVLEHLENPSKVLQESHRITKFSGKIIATMPFLYPIHADPYDYQRWTPEKIRLEFEKVGFTIENITPMGSLFAVIYDLLYVSLGVASKNRSALKNRVINKFLMPILAKLFMWLDKYYAYKGKRITTGYFVEAVKIKPQFKI
jgi:SAM-dependent methyltransferase